MVQIKQGCCNWKLGHCMLGADNLQCKKEWNTYTAKCWRIQISQFKKWPYLKIKLVSHNLRTVEKKFPFFYKIAGKIGLPPNLKTIKNTCFYSWQKPRAKEKKKLLKEKNSNNTTRCKYWLNCLWFQLLNAL